MFRKSVICILFLLLIGICSGQSVVNAEVTSVNDLVDIKSTDWAYNAVKELVEKYGIKGYPDETFKGNDKASRYEMASALDDVAVAIGEQMAKLGIEKADRKDLELVMQLQREFQVELAAFKLRAEAIERKNLDQDAQLTDHSTRIEKIEKVRNKRDIVLLTQSDLGKSVQDSMASTFRVRNDTEFTYHPDSGDGTWGEGKAFVRLTAAVGRVGPLNSTIPSGNVLNLYNDFAAVDASTADDTTRKLGYFSNTRAVAFVEQAYLAQDVYSHINGGKLNLNAGLMDVTNWFDTNLVANNETTQFLNFALTNNRMFTSAFIAPSAVANYYQPIVKDKLNLTLRAGIISLDPDNLNGEFTAMYEGDLQYFVHGKEGNLRVGGYNGYIADSDIQFVPNRIHDKNHNGVYVNFDQQLYKDIRVFGRYGVADSGPATEGLNNVRQAMSFGGEIPIASIFPTKRKDAWGFAYEFSTPITSQINNPDALDLTSEKLIETYYRFQINDSFSIGPDVQVIFDPGGFHGKPIAVLGLRSYITF